MNDQYSRSAVLQPRNHCLDFMLDKIQFKTPTLWGGIWTHVSSRS